MEWLPVLSSSVSCVGYSSETRVLGVEFRRGGRYAYWGVPEDEHVALMRAESIGLYLNRFIKGKYEHRRFSGRQP